MKNINILTKIYRGKSSLRRAKTTMEKKYEGGMHTQVIPKFSVRMWSRDNAANRSTIVVLFLFFFNRRC